MINHKVVEDNKYFHFIVEGHADHEPKENFDSVCGMVSVLTQAALYGCAKNCNKVRVTKQGKGMMDFYFPKSNSVCKAICDACHEGIIQVQMQFPDCFEEKIK